MPKPGRKIDIPPAVTEFVFDALGFFGRHVANGVRAAKSSLLREAGEEFTRRGEAYKRAADENDGVEHVPEIKVVDNEAKKRGARR